MAYKTVMTHVVDNSGCAARLRMAESVARVFSAEVIGVGAAAPWPYSSAEGHGRDFEKLVQVAHDDITTAERSFHKGLTDPSIPTAWRSEVGYPNAVLAKHARAADLVVAYRTSGIGDTSMYAEPDQLLMEAGLPILLMPSEEAAFKADTVLVAWKNTRESRRAITVALPVLIAAKRVLVAAICSARELEAVEKELADLDRRLSRHGVNTATLAEVDTSGDAGRRLLEIAKTDASDLIVAGGYGHSRLREWVLGGVTRELITDGARYVLLSH